VQAWQLRQWQSSQGTVEDQHNFQIIHTKHSWHKEQWKHPIDTLFATPSSIVNSEGQLKQQEGSRDCKVNSTGANQYFRKTLKISSARFVAAEVRSWSSELRARTLCRSVWKIDLGISRVWRFLCIWRIFVAWRCWNSFRLSKSLERFQGWCFRSWYTHRPYFRNLSIAPGIVFGRYEEQYEIRVLVRLPIFLPLLHQAVPRGDLGSWLNRFERKVLSCWCGRYCR